MTSNCWTEVAPRLTSDPRRTPSVASRSAGHRSPEGSGGSLTSTRDPGPRTNPSAHSIVTDGGPKERAVTTSKRPLWAASRPASSARPRTTATRSVSPSFNDCLCQEVGPPLRGVE